MNTQTLQLNSSVNVLPFVGPAFEKKLEKLGIFTIFDLLHHIPHRYIDFSKFTKIKDIKPDELISVFGETTSIINQPTKTGKLMQIATLSDLPAQVGGQNKINLIWFNQFYLTKTLYPSTKVIVSGKASWFNRKLAFFSPQYERMDYPHESVHTGKIIGIYPQTAGLTNKWLKARIKYVLDRIKIDEFLENKHNLLTFDEAIRKIHFPKSLEEAEKAKERLAFNEFYGLLAKARERKQKLLKKKGISLTVNHSTIQQFINHLDFKLTRSQDKVISEVLADLSKKTPMNRLLQGDVGSGKTIVATIAAYATHLAGYKTVFLAPTQILANQHYESIKKLFPDLEVSLVTASTVHRSQFTNHIIIGTHALLNKQFEKVGLLIIDEQHKFGVKQINFLQKLNPHVLTMTATPIPRTIAQTLFSDMDLSIIDELPKNRQKIKTWLVPNEKREKAYKWISSQITVHRSQCFIICPLVEDSEAETMKDIKSVTTEYAKLKTIFKSYNLGLLHGRLKEKEKTQVLNDFRTRKIDILVSTPVVEVGIDIPNATIMLIEAADRFGLAQLHQLRGRIGRGTKESYCLLFTENNSEKAIERLTAMTTMSSGFELAELDLKLRGAGDVLGTKQSGFNLKIADWSQTKLIKLASESVANL